ncbi:MAG: hypothetical protein VX320_02595 [Candidatus Thermoplasmatota archaeon]|nr:hypothetical protein [Candidatus Thermoplasmatota archaeon]MEE3082964.1 hypothetical protein [Candidatus Thermoplasmatota archaeon]
MRRKQTALLISLLIIGSMVFVSQIRPNNPVESVHPGDTTGEGPPVTDHDKDGMPDLHEEMFSESVLLDLGDRSKEIPGLDWLNGSDNSSDHDMDGLTALMEYCWPYDLDSCFTSNRTGLTGKPADLSETGIRWFLDPRSGDTDGDGLPDGFEVSMCMSQTAGGYLNSSYVWNCPLFDPLNASDGVLDSDKCPDLTLGCGDGFDVDRDGVIEPHEFYTNAEEYSYGSPENWTTEFDGLRCAGDIPFLVNPCLGLENRPTGDDGWLGTDPLRKDSDYFQWANGSIRDQSQKGDGIADGWEVYFQLDPRNSSDAFKDSDLDGWDFDRDGDVEPDQSIATIRTGEAYSNLEEYLVYLDDGNWVTAGVKHVELGEQDLVVTALDQGSSPGILHHDAHSIFSDDIHDLVYVGMVQGVTIIDVGDSTSTHLRLPFGVELHDMFLWGDGGSDGVLLLATSSGLMSFSLDEEGLLGTLVDEDDSPPIHVLTQLDTGSGALDMIGAGANQSMWRFSLDSEGRLGALSPIDQLSTILQEGDNASVITMTHVVTGTGPHLFVGTDKGLLMANSSDLSGGFPVSWIFDQTNAEDFVVTAHAIDPRISAIVQALVVDGPRDSSGEISSPQTLWVGTRGGVHQFDLITGVNNPASAFSRDRMAHPDERDGDANNIQDILPTEDGIIIGSQWGSWVLDGNYDRAIGIDPFNTRIPGKIADLCTLDVNGTVMLFAALDPGEYSNIALINPLSNDSDADGMPDGWEFIYGLDPTNPYDGEEDPDADGVNFNPDIDDYFDRNWTNLDEFRYVASTPLGWNSTDPLNSDDDGDGLLDGEEYWGFFLEHTNFTCHYLNGDYLCDEPTGEAARNTYISGYSNSGAGGGTDSTLDPTNKDSDQDGMPDGWEIQYRRWIGQTFTGGNDWSLDPTDPTDAFEDADGDGLSNLCEYQWQQVRLLVLEQGLPTHNETSEGAATWVDTDPNLIDSDGDGLPDGWEARYTCSWSSAQEGLNPLNGSDAGNNPDGDGYDVNHDGILSEDEMFNNWMEYYISRLIMLGDVDSDGNALPFTTSLFNESWNGSAVEPFGFFVTQEVLNDQPLAPSLDDGSSDPLNSDTDGDGMPDGWEVYFSRWDTFADDWTLNPVMEMDSIGDPDGDGMTNWEEYNSIDPMHSETNPEKTSPQYYIFGVGNLISLQVWDSAGSMVSFGEFVDDEQNNRSGMTCDPNNPDSDGDGLMDGLEVLFTQWNQTDQVWTLNPLVSGDGHYDGDQDALTDLQELNLTNNNPSNGGLSPWDAPKMWEEAFELNEVAATNRISSMLFSKGNRAMIVSDQFVDWLLDTEQPAPPLLSAILGISDPTDNDTDNDAMIDGYEYWFTEWDLEGSQWEMNPLTAEDIDYDSDNDSWDCNSNGIIEQDERYTNLREYEARIYGKWSERFSVPSELGLMSYGRDAMIAYQEDLGYDWSQARGELYDMFVEKDIMSSERMNRINEAFSGNWNYSLVGISDPTHPDSDGDTMPDGWEFCYSRYLETLPVLSLRWSLNPVNPLDVDYDPDADGWYDRTSGDMPALQGDWENRIFTSWDIDSQISPGNSPLYFTNLQEWNTGTHPIANDSDGDSVIMVRTEVGGVTTGYDNDWALLDGREVYKFGTNPLDDDTDGDMLPDFYEYSKGWNENQDNWSTLRQIKVVWEDLIIDPPLDEEKLLKPLNVSSDGSGGFILSRPNFEWTWATFDPRDPSDALEDPDNDGGWDCSGPTCIYIPYNNFQEYYGNTTLSSATQVRSTPLLYEGEQVQEWWQLRAYLLHIGESDDIYRNYFRMYRINMTDDLYAKILNDNDIDYMTMDPADDVDICRGDWTDDWERRFGTFNKFPDTGSGEYVWGWWNLDIDGDNVADGTDPLNFDTDGDWANDWFEIDDDMLDGIRGNDGSPLRYDDRNTM